MRYLLVVLAVLLIAWRWKASRSAAKRTAEHRQAVAPTALAMVPCTRCGLHVPQNDAVAGAKGAYCSAAHLRLSEP